MKTCKHCNKQVSGSHQCEVANRTINEDDDGDFLLSAAIGYATNSAILGSLVGGDLLGGIVGDALNTDSD
jgi:hypothetical protein